LKVNWKVNVSYKNNIENVGTEFQDIKNISPSNFTTQSSEGGNKWLNFEKAYSEYQL